MLDEAKKKCPQMDIRHASCDNMPFPDKTFDIIIACMAYHHFPEKQAFANEAARILKEGGKLYITDPKFPLPVRKVINTALSVHKVVGHFYTADEIVNEFSRYGFKKADADSDCYAQIIILHK